MRLVLLVLLILLSGCSNVTYKTIIDITGIHTDEERRTVSSNLNEVLLNNGHAHVLEEYAPVICKYSYQMRNSGRLCLKEEIAGVKLVQTGGGTFFFTFFKRMTSDHKKTIKELTKIVEPYNQKYNISIRTEYF